MSNPNSPYICTNCDSENQGAYCTNCGKARQLTRINGQYLISEVGSIFNFEKGILYTLRELLLRPGDSIRKFIQEDRNRLVKPVVFIILCSLVYTVTQQALQFEDGYVNYGFEEGSASTLLFQWVSQNYGYSNFLMAFFIALWIKLLFKGYKYNFFEILILLCFVMGMGMLLFALFGLIQSMVDYEILDGFFFIGLLYMSWAIGQFFDKKNYVNYLKAFACYMLGIFTFSFTILAVGATIDQFL